MNTIENRLTEALEARAERVDASSLALETGTHEREPSILRRYRGWAVVPAAAATVVAIIAGASALTGPGGQLAGPATRPKPTQTTQHPDALPDQAWFICGRALGDRVATAAKTTLYTVRRSNFGGPAPGITPGKGVFPGVPGSQVAAWCWTPQKSTGDSSPGNDWQLYVAIPDGRSKRLFVMGSSGAPVGPPQIP